MSLNCSPSPSRMGASSTSMCPCPDSPLQESDGFSLSGDKSIAVTAPISHRISRPLIPALPGVGDSSAGSDHDPTPADTSITGIPGLYSQANAHLTEDATSSQSDDNISLQELTSATTAGFGSNDLTLRQEGNTADQGILSIDARAGIVVIHFLYRHIFLLHFLPAHYKGSSRELVNAFITISGPPMQSQQQCTFADPESFVVELII